MPLKEVPRCYLKLHPYKVKDGMGVDLKPNFASKLVGALQKYRFPGSPKLRHTKSVSIGVAKKFVRVFPRILRKNPNELFGQPNI